jgi:heat shock protein HslJ
MSFFTLVRRIGSGALLITGLLALLAACSTAPAQQDGAQSARYQPANASDFLAQTSWTLVRWSRIGGALRPVPHNDPRNRPITITFTHERGELRVTGFAGCNTYSSNYTVANGALILTAPPVATRLACYPADRTQIEQDYLAGLTRIRASAVDSYGDPRRLTLTLENGDILDFARRIDPVMGGQTGARKLVYVNSQRVACDAGVMRTSCYQVRDSDDQPWQLWYGDIVGFDFKPGIIYRLRVVESPVMNPPPDMPAVQWVLDTVVEQRVVGY